MPQQPSILISNDLTVTTDLRIQLSWGDIIAVNQMGGIYITTYEIWWTDGTFSYEPLFNDTVPF